jgi:hypothetical protein
MPYIQFLCPSVPHPTLFTHAPLNEVTFEMKTSEDHGIFAENSRSHGPSRSLADKLAGYLTEMETIVFRILAVVGRSTSSQSIELHKVLYSILEELETLGPMAMSLQPEINRAVDE